MKREGEGRGGLGLWTVLTKTGESSRANSALLHHIGRAWESNSGPQSGKPEWNTCARGKPYMGT